MNRIHIFLRLALVSVISSVLIFSADARKNSGPKYVFFMIGDGMGINQVYGAQNYNQVTGDGPQFINFTQFPVRTMVTTFSSSSLVTDSAASGTALSSGVKTYNGAIGLDPDHKPIPSICVWAHNKGFGTGVATTVGVNHATPAAFYGHADNRNEYEKIANQLIESDFIDFAAGGGFIVERNTGHDSKYFEDKAKDAGITVLYGRDQFKNLSSQKGRVICVDTNYSSTDVNFAMDQKPGETTLSDFVAAGIDYLYGNFGKKGFFYMVECGEIDGAGHNNDAICNIKEVNDFAKAIDVVLDFYKKHPDETLILITADHETGGLELGDNYIMHPEYLYGHTKSEGEINKLFREFAGVGPDRNPLPNRRIPTYQEMQGFLSEHLGLWSTIKVSEAQEAHFRDLYHRAFVLNQTEMVEALYSVSNRIVSDAIAYADRQAGYIWTHGGHTGSPVGLYVKGAGAVEFMAVTDNSMIPLTIKKVANY